MTKNGQMPELSPASALRRKIERRTLPVSGAVVDLRRPSLFMLLAKSESLPDTLLAYVVEQIEQGIHSEMNGGKPVAKKARPKIETAKVAGEGLALMKAMVVEAIVAPRVVLGEAKNADEVSIDEMEDGDLEYIYTWLEGMTPRQKQSFRHELLDGVGDLPAGEGVREDAGDDSGD